MRCVEDPHILLHEITAIFESTERRFCAVMGAFVKAFPRCWREDVLLILKTRVPDLRGSSFALLRDILEPNIVRVHLGSCSGVQVRQGIPEGGNTGTLLYSVLPD